MLNDPTQNAQLDHIMIEVPDSASSRRFYQNIEYCSAFTPLTLGDIIATGTLGVVGFKREPQVFMQPGDIVEVEIKEIGVLRNKVGDETSN